MRVRKVAIGILLPLLLALLAPVANAQGGGTSTRFGVHEFNIAAGQGQPNRTALVNDVGASFIRLPISWHLMEGSEKGVTPGWYWNELDADIAAAEDAGLDVLITFGQTPCWASSDPQKNCSGGDATYLKFLPIDAQDYADALGRLVARYGDRVMAWEIWNEPNLAGNLRSDRCPGSGDERGICTRPSNQNDEYDMFGDLGSAYEYAELVRLGARAAVQADPNAKVLVGSIAGGDVVFLEHMYEAGLGNDYHAISAHPYTGPYPNSPNGMSYGPAECPQGIGRNAAFWCFQNGIEALHGQMTAYGDSRSMWFTEFGFASTTTWNGSGEEGQAEHLTRAVELIEGWSYVPVAAWYQLVDQIEDDREGTFGLFTRSGQIKPSGEAYKDALSGVTPPVDPPVDPPTNGAPQLFWPVGADLNDPTPFYEWSAVDGAIEYQIWVNQYGSQDSMGKVNAFLTPNQASCAQDDLCGFVSNKSIAPYGEWWVTAYFADGSSIESQGAAFEQ